MEYLIRVVLRDFYPFCFGVAFTFVMLQRDGRFRSGKDEIGFWMVLGFLTLVLYICLWGKAL